MELIENPNMTATEVIEAEKRMLSVPAEWLSLKRSRHILLETQFAALVNRLAAMEAPLSAHTTAADIRKLAAHMQEVADAVDCYFTRIGSELAWNAPCSVQRSLFIATIDGNAIHEITRVADLLAEDEA